MRTNFTILDPSRLFQRGISCCERGDPRRLDMATVIDDENGDLRILLDCLDHSMLNSGRTKTLAEEIEKMGTKRTKKNSELQAL